MAGNILNFFPANTQPASIRPTLAEVAFHRARFGLHLYDPATPPPQTASPCIDLLDQATFAATRIELAIANRNARDRHRRLFPTSH